MNATSIAEINAQIAKLQAQAEALKAKEIANVIALSKKAIAHYGLTAADLGLTKVGKAAAGAPAQAGRKPARKSAGPKTASVAKYKDDAGNSWSGHGRRPGWFVAALGAGKTAEDMLVK